MTGLLPPGPAVGRREVSPSASRRPGRLPEMLDALDSEFPPAGPCLFCGGPDKRHLLWDTVEGYVRAGESMRSIRLNWPEMTARRVRLLAEAYAEARRRRVRLPGRWEGRA